MRKIDECHVEEFGTLYDRDKTIVILEDRLWLQSAKQKGIILGGFFTVLYGKNEMSALLLLEVYLLEIGTVHRLEWYVNGKKTKPSRI